MRKLAAQRNPKAETRDTRHETRNTLTATAAEPMEEGLAKKKIRPNGFFKRMSDDRLIEYTREVMKEKGITTRGGLRKADSGLYSTLLRRELLERVGFEEVRRKERNWAMMSDKELVRAAQEFLKENEITTREGVKKADSGLERVLRRRNLLGQMIPESANELHRDWVGMSDERIVEFTQEFMKGKGITTRKGLQKADSGLYSTLLRRELLERVGFEEVRRKERNWAMMSDKELVRAAQEFLKENEITTREGLEKADSGLRTVLRRRNLLGQVIPESKHEGYRERRDWTAMTDPELIEFTQEVMNGKGITTREGLKKADYGLYDALRRRKLLDRVFAEIDEKRQEESLDAVCEALERFGEEG